MGLLTPLKAEKPRCPCFRNCPANPKRHGERPDRHRRSLYIRLRTPEFTPDERRGQDHFLPEQSGRLREAHSVLPEPHETDHEHAYPPETTDVKIESRNWPWFICKEQYKEPHAGPLTGTKCRLAACNQEMKAIANSLATLLLACVVRTISANTQAPDVTKTAATLCNSVLREIVTAIRFGMSAQESRRKATVDRAATSLSRVAQERCSGIARLRRAKHPGV